MFGKEAHKEPLKERIGWECVNADIGRMAELMEGDLDYLTISSAFSELGEVFRIEEIYLCRKDGEFKPTMVFVVYIGDKVLGYDLNKHVILGFGDEEVFERILNYAIVLQIIEYFKHNLYKLELPIESGAFIK